MNNSVYNSLCPVHAHTACIFQAISEQVAEQEGIRRSQEKKLTQIKDQLERSNHLEVIEFSSAVLMKLP